MAGKGNEANARAEAVLAALTHEIDRCLTALSAAEVKASDVAGIDRHVRCVANVARAEKAARALIGKTEQDEAGMGDDDRGHEPDDPEELERLHRELRSRVERVRAALDVKRGDGWAYNPRREADAGGDAGAADPSVGAA